MNIGYFPKPESEKLLNDIFPNEQGENVKNRLEEFYKLVDFFYPVIATDMDGKITRENRYKKQEEQFGIQFIELELREKFRFVSIKDDDQDEKRTFVWIVDFKEGDSGKFKPFEKSVVFQTKEERFLGLLENIFDPVSKKKDTNIPANKRESAKNKGGRSGQNTAMN